MANRKLSIGCVLIMGGALTNCGGVVETHGDGTGNDHGGAPGSGGYVGVPVGTGGGFMGTCCPGIAGTGGYPGTGGGPLGMAGYFPMYGDGFGGTFPGYVTAGGHGGAPGLPYVGVGAGAGPYVGGEGGVGGDYWDGTPGVGGNGDNYGGAGGSGGDDGI